MAIFVSRERWLSFKWLNTDIVPRVCDHVGSQIDGIINHSLKLQIVHLIFVSHHEWEWNKSGNQEWVTLLRAVHFQVVITMSVSGAFFHGIFIWSPSCYKHCLSRSLMWSYVILYSFCQHTVDNTEYTSFINRVIDVHYISNDRVSYRFCPTFLEPGWLLLLNTFGKTSSSSPNLFYFTGIDKFVDTHWRYRRRYAVPSLEGSLKTHFSSSEHTGENPFDPSTIPSKKIK